jgi:tetratricopeptide (TPR) repeat protein
MRRKKKFKKKLRKIIRILLPVFSVMFILTVFTSGYFYFFESNMKANYYFQQAQKLDNANPYGAREAIRYYSAAIASYEAIGERGAAVNAYIHLGLLHHKFGNILQVERMVLNAMQMGGNDIPKHLKAKAYMLLASTAEPERAKEYIKEAIAISEELNQKILGIKSYFILAKIYEYKADFEKSKKTYLAAIKIAENLTPEDGFFDPEPLYSNLGELYAGEGAIIDAIYFYEKALAVTKQNTNHSIIIANYMKILGDLYQSKMQPSKACENWIASKEEYILAGKQPPMSVLQLSMSDNCYKPDK